MRGSDIGRTYPDDFERGGPHTEDAYCPWVAFGIPARVFVVTDRAFERVPVTTAPEEDVDRIVRGELRHSRPRSQP